MVADGRRPGRVWFGTDTLRHRASCVGISVVVVACPLARQCQTNASFGFALPSPAPMLPFKSFQVISSRQVVFQWFRG